MTSEENEKEAQRIREKIKVLNISEKKELTTDMKTYLMKSVKNGGGRIDMQGTILKLNLI